MKIAIPTANGQICMHFGHCELFTIFDVDKEAGSIISCQTELPPPHEPGVLPKWLGDKGVNVIIAGGMGMRAQQLFSANNVDVVVGVSSGEPEGIVKAFLDNTLVTGANVCDH